MATEWKGTFTALVTPFTADGAVDDAALGRLIELQVDGGVEGLVPCGTTGEAATLSNQEHIDVIARVVDLAGGRVPVLAGVGGNNTRNVIHLSRQAQRVGVDGVLAVAPYYNKPTQAGMLLHFKAIADSIEIPLVLYNVPGRTSSNLLPMTVLELAAHPAIVAIKEASGDLSQVMAILAGRPAGFSVLSGEDNLTFPLIGLGADGVISVVSNEVPRRMSDMVRQALRGEAGLARRAHFELLPLMEGNFIETNPIPVKAALAMMGLIEESYRLPLAPMEPGNRALLRDQLHHLDLVDAAP